MILPKLSGKYFAASICKRNYLIIEYNLPVAGQVNLKIYDVRGREAVTLVDEYKPAGYYRVSFNAKNNIVAIGVYFYKLTSGSFSQTRKMILIK